MADKENEGKVNKLKRKFSRKSIGKAPTSTPAPEAAAPISGKSATLPLSLDAKSLAYHEGHSEGIFSKLRRRFRLGSKGKYDLKSYTENSPSKRWLRRKSEETQLQSDENLSVDPRNAVGKSNSVKTQRKAKSDKEEVILIRKDKRVSVICKAENGESEVIFSNVNSPDEDFSETVSEVDEDPYATISSVKDEIAKNKNQTVVNRQNGVEKPLGATSINTINDTEKTNTNAFIIDEYPYAKINPDRKKLLAVSQPSLDAKNFSKQTDIRIRSQFEPDYETLDDIKQKKNEFRSQRNMLSSSFEADSNGTNVTCSFDSPSGIDPDYESLEEVKQRYTSTNMSSHTDSSTVTNALLSKNSGYQPLVLEKAAVESIGVNSHFSQSQNSGETHSNRQSPLLGASTDNRRYPRTTASSSQGSRPASMPSPYLGGRTSSASSPSALAPLAPSIDSSLPYDNQSHQQASPQEECLYDNPNVILRKQVSRSITNASTLTRRGQTYSEPPIIKTPAEEELVEKLSALLAPPLPLRNYLKDEVNPRSGTGSARHSWSSQGSRVTESGETTQVKDIERSPISSLNHSRENLLLKSVKDSLVSQVYERHDMFSRSNGADMLRKKDGSGLEKYLRKSSPQTVRSNKQLERSKDAIRSDYTVINIVKGKLETSICIDDSVVENLSNGGKKEVESGEIDSISSQSRNLQEINIASFCQELVENILEDVFKKCKNSKLLLSDVICQNAIKTDKTMEDLNPLQISSEKDKATSVTKNTEITSNIDSVSCINSQSDIKTERYAKYVSPQVSDSSNCLVTTTCENVPSGPLDNIGPAISDRTERSGEKDLEDGIGKNVCSNGKTVERENVLYNLQGARPKVKSLLFDQAAKSSPELNDSTKSNKSLAKFCSNGGGEPKVEVVKTASGQLSQVSLIRNEPDSSVSSSVNFHNGIEKNVLQQRTSKKLVKNEWIKNSDEEYNDGCFENSDFSIQETVYVDSDSDNDCGLELNKRVTVQVKRNQCISKVAKPVIYANPRLLENVISGPFKREISLDTAYLAHGVFRWGRFFPALNENRQAVEDKLKAFMNFVIEMILSPSRFRRNQPRIKKLQEEVDVMQLKIEKRLRTVQDLPTFSDIRLHLLKISAIDDWEPEKPVGGYFDQSEGHRDLGRITNDEIKAKNAQGHACDHGKDSETVVKRQCSDMHPGKRFSVQYTEAEDILHSEEPYCDELFSANDNRQSALTLPTSPSDVLDEFLRLSRSRLNCRYCNAVEESDSEDEMVAVETYTKTVSANFCPQYSDRVDIGAASLCRAFHGELAYTAYMRKHRAPRKFLAVPGHDSECGGSESHLSWNNWCTLDALVKKLVPHISPRLDFQYMLRTYAEFKHFILIDRKRNLERKGCFMKKVPDHVLKCCRFEEFVFLKIIRDEIRHFAHVFSVSEVSRDLFLEERDVGFTLLSLLRLVLQNIHKMRKSMSKEEVGVIESEDNLVNKKGVHFRHSSFKKWPVQEDYFVDSLVSTDQQKFHIKNFENFRFGCLSLTLRNWKSPQAYVHDPNVLVSCRPMFAQSDIKALDLTGIKGVEEPKPLQEQQDFLESMEQLQLKDWYWGPISYEQATLILKEKEDGSFLVRDSSDQKYLLSLSFKSLGEVHHTRIEHAKGLFSFWSQPESHGKARICEFIEKSIQNSRDGRFLYFLRPSARGTPPLPIRLLTPVSRNFRVATLKHLSRFVVRQSVRKDHLDLLPVPEKVKRYLRDKQYYVEILDDDQWAFDGDYGKSSK